MDPQEEKEYRDAFVTHQALRAELERAQTHRDRVTKVLLWGGAAIVAAGWLTGKLPANQTA